VDFGERSGERGARSEGSLRAAPDHKEGDRRRGDRRVVTNPDVGEDAEDVSQPFGCLTAEERGYLTDVKSALSDIVSTLLEGADDQAPLADVVQRAQALLGGDPSPDVFARLEDAAAVLLTTKLHREEISVVHFLVADDVGNPEAQIFVTTCPITGKMLETAVNQVSRDTDVH